MKVVVVAADCHRCGKPFSYQPKLNARGYWCSRPRQYCGSACRGRSWVKDAPGRALALFTCVECGKRFETVNTGRNRFCSSTCRKSADRRRPARHEHTCAWCGKRFWSVRPDSKFCSRRCVCDANRVEGSEKTGNHRARCLKFGVPYDPSIRREQVLDRDDWTCWLCGDPIPDDVPYPDRLYGTIDHVIPLSAGGAHSWDNVRAAHLFCNCSRGARDATRTTAKAARAR